MMIGTLVVVVVVLVVVVVVVFMMMMPPKTTRQQTQHAKGGKHDARKDGRPKDKQKHPKQSSSHSNVETDNWPKPQPLKEGAMPACHLSSLVKLQYTPTPSDEK